MRLQEPAPPACRSLGYVLSMPLPPAKPICGQASHTQIAGGARKGRQEVDEGYGLCYIDEIYYCRTCKQLANAVVGREVY
jgi:hypothetical protein